MNADLPTVLRNKLVALIRSLRGPQITAADRVEVISSLCENFCPKCGQERVHHTGSCGPITVADAEEILRALVRADELFSHHGVVTARGDGSTYRMLADLINKRVWPEAKKPEPARNLLGDRVVDDDEFVTAKGDPRRHDP